MADFRKLFPVLAVAATMMLASSANAQVPAAFICNANAGVPPIVRAEGLAELVGDLVLNCTGGVPTVLGGIVPQINVQIFLNTNVTSRLTNDPWSEALLMIDEPGPGQQTTCTPGPCSIAGTGAAINYSAPGNPNVFQGRQSGANQLVWLGVPIDAPGTTGTRIIRITNVRANANQLGVSSTLIPTQIVMFISATGTTSIPINQPQQTIAFIQPGMTVSRVNIRDKVLLQCSSQNSGLSTDSSRALAQGATSVLRFREGFASAFKRRNANLGSSADVTPTPTNQNGPGLIYNTETGFYNNLFTSTNGLNNAGLADHGTRLLARFSNVPAGVSVYVSAYSVVTNNDDNIILFYNGNGNTLANGPVVRLVATDANGAGAFSPATITSNQNAAGNNSGTGLAPIAPVVLSNGTGTAVWEVMNSDPLAQETVKVAVFLAYTANTSANLPGLGTPSVNLNYAPISTVTTASASAPLPRFADTSSSLTLVAINSCTTNVLFPFLTNQIGFDSGVAISNTSTDPFGTSPQSGPCKLNYYGETTGGGAAPAAQTSQVVATGKQLLFTLSSGGNLGIAATPGFQGYMIAQCGFQYAHGFAFISDVGAQKFAEAYLALTLDNNLGSRTGFVSEVLGH